MKKIAMLFMATAMIAFVACGGGKKKSDDTATVAEETAVVEETVAPSSSSSSSDVVAQYVALCEKMIELAPKMKSGDMTAAQEYQKLALDYASYAENNQDAWNNLSEADLEKINEIALKVAAAMQ